MDHFGICAGIAGAVETYLRTSRGTWRTTSLVDSVKEGDAVVFVDGKQAKRFEELCRERGIEIETRVCDPRHPDALFQRPPLAGERRLIFDHAWVESYTRQALEFAAADINRWQKELSGQGALHRETKRRAQEMARWQL